MDEMTGTIHPQDLRQAHQRATTIAPPSKQHRNLRNPLHPSIIDRLDPAFVKLYNDHLANNLLPSDLHDIHSVRQSYSSLYAFATAPASGVGGIGETQVPGWIKYPGDVNVRVYVPPGEEMGTRKVWPVHFNFHGGGWAAGDLETDAHICHHICATVPCCVIDVEYRLIPEYPFPIGIMDSLSAVVHILANHFCFSIDPSHITFGGSCTGGTIALVLNHIFRDYNLEEKLKGVIIGTPSIADIKKYAAPEMSPWPSMQASETYPLLNWSKMKWFDTFIWVSLSAKHHPFTTPKEQSRDVMWYSNLLSASNFKKLAPITYIATAEFDPLRDEAEAYAKILEEEGNNVILRRFEGVPHAFEKMDGLLWQGREYIHDVIRHVRQCLYPAISQDKENEGEMPPVKQDDQSMTEPVDNASQTLNSSEQK